MFLNTYPFEQRSNREGSKPFFALAGDGLIFCRHHAFPANLRYSSRVICVAGKSGSIPGKAGEEGGDKPSPDGSCFSPGYMDGRRRSAA